MTNEEVRKLLEAKFQGLEGAIQDWQVGKITKQCQSNEDAERVVEGLSLQKLVEGYADYRATQASQSAVANYKRELEVAEGAKEQVETESAKPAEKIDEDGTPAWAKALIEQNKALGKRIGELEYNATSDVYKPLAVSGNAYGTAESGFVPVGVVISTVPASEPFVGVMTMGQMVKARCPYTMSDEVVKALPHINLI